MIDTHLVMTPEKSEVGLEGLVVSFVMVTYACSGMGITAFTALTVGTVTILRHRRLQ